MDTTTIISFLRKTELFSELSLDELQGMVAAFGVCSFDHGQDIQLQDVSVDKLYFVYSGSIRVYKVSSDGGQKKITIFSRHEFINETVLINPAQRSASHAKAYGYTELIGIDKNLLLGELQHKGDIAIKVYSAISRIIMRRMEYANYRKENVSNLYRSQAVRTEKDLLGSKDVPQRAYYGIQTLRATDNFNINGVLLNFYPELVNALAVVKKSAAMANNDLGLLPPELAGPVKQACDEISHGMLHNQFIVDLIQGGAGTSTNMNANEVIANRVLEILGKNKGEYQFCHPNNHINLSQSTNDAYPTAVKIALYNSNAALVPILNSIIQSLESRAEDFLHILKMGRTQLQDAVPMTLGQSFQAFASTLREEVKRLNENARLFLSVNMGGTAIGTGINADPAYSELVIRHLQKNTGHNIQLADDLIEATHDMGSFVMYSSALKRLAIKLSKICNDLRLMSSGPRAGFNEINLPPVQPGSSIMPGKVNPVIPEVVNQIAFKVIGNDITITMAAEAGQLELNVMEPVIVESLLESIEMLKNGIAVLDNKCVGGITANPDVCRSNVENSIGIVTALNPYLGYEVCSKLAMESLETGASIYDLVLQRGIMSQQKLNTVLSPENMVAPTKRI